MKTFFDNFIAPPADRLKELLKENNQDEDFMKWILKKDQKISKKDFIGGK